MCERLADKGIGYGVPGIQIDGNDILAVHRAVKEAGMRARNGEGPTLIEAMTFRMRGHEEASGTKYVPKSLFELWEKKDPLLRYEKHLDENKILGQAEREEIADEFKAQINQAVEEAFAAPKPTSTVEKELSDVYAPAIHVARNGEAGKSEKRYIDAISDGLRQKMREDESILIMGQDIAEYGGVFKITQGFQEEFGKSRVRNTPIIESGAIGAALGLALEGLKTVVEMQFADFVTCGFNQIVNNLAKTHYRWGEPVNVTIRLPFGGDIGAGPFHSQTPEAWFFHTPGLKLVAPSNPYDAKGLTIAALEDPNPVLVLEHKALYRSQKTAIPNNLYAAEIGKGALRREGDRLTIISYGLAVHWAMEAAEKFSREGIEIEVIDLRSLTPWDKELVLNSVKKTSRAVVLHEANMSGGIGGEIVSVIADQAFSWLDAPVKRIASLDMPIPFSEQLEKTIYLPKERLEPTIRDVLSF